MTQVVPLDLDSAKLLLDYKYTDSARENVEIFLSLDLGVDYNNDLVLENMPKPINISTLSLPVPSN